MHLSNTNERYFKEYYHRLQHFVVWYIDGASYVDFDDDRWNYFIMYVSHNFSIIICIFWNNKIHSKYFEYRYEKYLNENQEYSYGVVGFCTVYEFYAYPNHIRPRISQLLVLPPFQKQGLAVHLVNTVYKHYIHNDRVIDITSTYIFFFIITILSFFLLTAWNKFESP